MSRAYTIYNAAMRFAVVASFIFMVSLELKDGFQSFNTLTLQGYSALFPDLVAPSFFALGIQSLLYLLLGAFAFYQLRNPSGANPSLSPRTMNLLRLEFILAVVLHVFWLAHWGWGNSQISFLFLMLLFLLLMSMNSLLRGENGHKKEKLFLKAPLAFFWGWVTMILMAQVSLLLFLQGPSLFSNPPPAALIFLIMGTLMSIVILLYYRNSSFGLVVLWTYGGILFNHLSSGGLKGQHQEVMLMLVTCMVALLITTAYSHLNERLS